MTDMSHRTKLRRWIRENVREGWDEGDVEFYTKQKGEEAWSYACSQHDIVEGFAAEPGRPYIFDEVRAALRPIKALQLASPSDGRTLVIRQRREEAWNRKWQEFCVYADGRYKHFLDMRREDLLQSSRNYRFLALVNDRRASFLESVASNLEEGERVKDRYSSEELTHLWFDAQKGGGTKPSKSRVAAIKS